MVDQVVPAIPFHDGIDQPQIADQRTEGTVRCCRRLEPGSKKAV